MTHWATDHLRIVLHRQPGPVTPEDAREAAGLGMEDYLRAIQDLADGGELEYHDGGETLALRDGHTVEAATEDTDISDQPTTKMAAVGYGRALNTDDDLINAYLAVRLEDADGSETVQELRDDAELFAAIAPRVWERLR